MKITLSIIAKELSCMFSCKQNREKFTDIPLSGVLFYCGRFVAHNLHIHYGRGNRNDVAL